jgi:hypothetical protein
VTCPKCGKPDWSGCGAHVEQVLGDVPKGERCRCREQAAAAPDAAANASSSGGVFGRLFGKK